MRPDTNLETIASPVYYRHYSTRAPATGVAQLPTEASAVSEKAVTPVKFYPNAWHDKSLIYRDNKGKSGIYLWRKLDSNKKYVGSAKDLRCRFKNYFHKSYIIAQLKKGKSKIYSSLLKNGYDKFSLEILEYCSEADLAAREQYYLDNLIDPPPGLGPRGRKIITSFLKLALHSGINIQGPIPPLKKCGLRLKVGILLQVLPRVL